LDGGSQPLHRSLRPEADLGGGAQGLRTDAERSHGKALLRAASPLR